jgi:hypothetical protein
VTRYWLRTTEEVSPGREGLCWPASVTLIGPTEIDDQGRTLVLVDDQDAPDFLAGAIVEWPVTRHPLGGMRPFGRRQVGVHDA